MIFKFIFARDNACVITGKRLCNMKEKEKIAKKIAEPIIPAKEHVYLEGPKSRGYEFVFLFKVAWEFFKGLRNLHFIGPCVTVFGSARFKEGDIYYEKARVWQKDSGYRLYNHDRRRPRHYGSGQPRCV